MLRERRRHANFKPNRKLDPKSSRSTIYENEELRLRTININAEVERGQSDIKKLRKENDQLRREIWALRDEYDRLDKLLQASRNGRNILNQLNNSQLDSDADGPRCDSCNQSEDSGDSSCDTCDDDNEDNETVKQTYSHHLIPPKAKEKLHVNFDHLSIVSEETFTSSCENPSSPNLTENNFVEPIEEESSDYNPDVCSALIDFQSIVPPLAYFENLIYEDIGPNLDASGEIHYSCESLNSKPIILDPSIEEKSVPRANEWDFSSKTKGIHSSISGDNVKIFDRQGPDLFVQNAIPSFIGIPEPIYAEIKKKPASIFQVGGNLDDLLQNIEHLSKDIIQIQNENQKITSKYSMTTTTIEKPVINTTNSTLSTIQQQAKPYRSEMNLMLSFDGNIPKIKPIENETNDTTSANANKQDTPPPSIPTPMNLLPTTLPYIASDVAVTLSSNDTKCFERLAETKDCNYLETIRRKIFPRKTDAVKCTEKSNNSNVKLENESATDVEKIVENTVNRKTLNVPDVIETKRKSRRVSLLFNVKKNGTAENQPKIENTNKDSLSAQNKSKHHHRKVHRRHSDGNLLNRSGSHDSGMTVLGRCSSRESSASLKSQKSQKSQKSRKSSKSKSSKNTNVGKIPWFGCWGNECMY